MKISVVGAGSWGTALASLLSGSGHDVTIWALEDEVAEQINRSHKNDMYLAGYDLPPALRASSSLEEVLDDTELVVNVVPTQFVARVWNSVSLPTSVPVVTASKGIERSTLRLVTGILDDVLVSHGPLLVLSGPSFAEEVMKRHPTNVTLASEDRNMVRQVAEVFHMPWFRVYGWHDPTGVQIAGALKNVMAIASGAVEGMGFGNNTRAALITRGLSEIARIGVAMGSDPMTFMGLAGLGDLVLTCTGGLSRNRMVGLRLGRGESLEDILAGMNSVAEGVATSESAYRLAESLGVDSPIISAVYSGIYEGISPRDALNALLSRTLKQDGIEGMSLDAWSYDRK